MPRQASFCSPYAPTISSETHTRIHRVIDRIQVQAIYGIIYGITIAYILASTSCSSSSEPLTLTIVNVEGSAVTVEPWEGAEPKPLPCGESLVFDSPDYPDGPWHVRITLADTQEKIFERTVQGPHVFITVRNGGAVVGDQLISGPAPATTCPPAFQTNDP